MVVGDDGEPGGQDQADRQGRAASGEEEDERAGSPARGRPRRSRSRSRSRRRRTRSASRSRSRGRRSRSRGRRSRSRGRRSRSRGRRSRSRGRYRTRSRTGSREVREEGWEGQDLRARLVQQEEQRLLEEVRDLKRVVSCLQAKSGRPSFPTMQRKNHQEQMKVLEEIRSVAVDEMRIEHARVFPAGGPSSLEAIVEKTEKLINFRCKVIAFADSSNLGWAAANEWAAINGAEGDADVKQMEEAERRAQRKIDRKKKDEEDAQRRSRGTRGREARSRTRSPRKKGRSKSRSKPR